MHTISVYHVGNSESSLPAADERYGSQFRALNAHCLKLSSGATAAKSGENSSKSELNSISFCNSPPMEYLLP